MHFPRPAKSMLALFFVAAAVVANSAACTFNPYENKSQVKSVRILATKAEPSYAHPGETVSLEALVFDGRDVKTPDPMRFFWFPVPCTNPPGAQYFNCYPALEAAYPNLGVDISSQLVEDTKYSITIPPTALDGIDKVPGTTGEPRVTTWQFMIACAGQVQRRARVTRYQENQPPFGCFGADGKELPIEFGSFAFMRVTVAPTERNAHPKINSVVWRGKVVDPVVGLSLIHCELDRVELLTDGNCDTFGMDVAFDDSAQELDPSNVDAFGKTGRETIYTDWFVTLGRFPEPRNIQRDPFVGRPEAPETLYEPPRNPGRGIMWAVLHDNRGGTDWTSIPVEIR